jgi:hypothetical protein
MCGNVKAVGVPKQHDRAGTSNDRREVRRRQVADMGGDVVAGHRELALRFWPTLLQVERVYGRIGPGDAEDCGGISGAGTKIQN